MISPMYEGDTVPALDVTFAYDNGAVIVLTGLASNALTLRLYNINTKKTKTGTGSWIIIDAVNGKALYQWNAADTNAIGSYQLYCSIQTSAGTFHLDPVPLEIKQAP